MNIALSTALAACGLAFATCATAQVTFYENEGFSGRTFTTQKPVPDLARLGFNDRASSVIVANDRWEVCDDARFGGRWRGNDVATVGGAVIGGVVGANTGRDNGSTYSKDVRRCDSAPSQARADYWDVTYTFRGQEHRMQMSTPPGRTVSVNSQGEPRA